MFKINFPGHKIFGRALPPNASRGYEPTWQCFYTKNVSL